MHTTNYTRTLIRPSPDCRAPRAIAPEKPESVAFQQFALLSNAPFEMTSDDIIIAVQAKRHAVPKTEIAAFRAKYFSKGQPCLRCSPLVKTHGWALYHDADARVGLVDPASNDFERLQADRGVQVIDGMRSRKA